MDQPEDFRVEGWSFPGFGLGKEEKDVNCGKSERWAGQRMNYLLPQEPGKASPRPKDTKLALGDRFAATLPSWRSPTNFSLNRDLRGNAFHCDCKLKWLVEWLSHTSALVEPIECHSPAELNRTSLSELRPGGFSCITTGRSSFVLGRVPSSKEGLPALPGVKGSQQV